METHTSVTVSNGQIYVHLGGSFEFFHCIGQVCSNTFTFRVTEVGSDVR